MTKVYRKWRQRLASSSGTDWSNVRAMLVMTWTTADTDEPEFIDEIGTLDELDATGYSRQSLTGESVVDDWVNNRIELIADAINFSSPSADASRYVSGLLLYEFVTDDTDSPVIAYYDEVASGQTFPFQVDGSAIVITPSSEGLIQII